MNVQNSGKHRQPMAEFLAFVLPVNYPYTSENSQPCRFRRENIAVCDSRTATGVENSIARLTPAKEDER